MNQLRKKFCYLLFCVVLLVPARAFGFQDNDSTQHDHEIKVITGALASIGEESPFWIRANNSQRIATAPNSIWQRVIFQKPLNKTKRFDWGYGLELIGRQADGWSGDFTQAFIEGKNKYFNFFIGRKEERLGVVDSTLSLGTLVNGNNALPLPKIAIQTNGWLDVPLTNGWVQFNAYFSHGWFEEDRFIQNALLHQKSLYLNLGAKWPVNVYSGIVFNTQWGGTRSDNGEKEPSSLEDYLRIVLGLEGGSNAAQQDRTNALGNHLGSWDIGFTGTVGAWRLMNYYQFLWEDSSGLTPFNWRDGIFGISAKRTDKDHWFTGFNFEIVRTTDQDLYKVADDGTVFTEPDNFFNNGVYRSGWSYQNVVIGSPLFLLPNKNDLNSTRRINGLINAWNVGVEGNHKRLNYRANFRYFKNQGTHFQRFPEPFELFSTIMDVQYELNTTSKLSAVFSFDIGKQIENQYGLMLEYSKVLFK